MHATVKMMEHGAVLSISSNGEGGRLDRFILLEWTRPSCGRSRLHRVRVFWLLGFFTMLLVGDSSMCIILLAQGMDIVASGCNQAHE